MRKHLSNKNSRNGTDPPQDGINTLPGKDSHLCLIVCFASSSEHTISNRLSAGPLTQTGLPDGRRLFHSTGKQQGGGGEFFVFFCRRKGQLFYAPPPLIRMGMKHRSGAKLSVPLHGKWILVVSAIAGIRLDQQTVYWEFTDSPWITDKQWTQCEKLDGLLL